MATDSERARVAQKEMRGDTLTANEQALADETATWGSDQLASDLRAWRSGNRR